MSKNPKSDADARGQQKLRALVVTALSLEFNSARKFLENPQEVIQGEGRIDEQGTFTARDTLWDVRLIQCGMGNTDAALETQSAIQEFSPDVALFIGIAGGIKDVAIGDVVIADCIYNYQGGKAEDEFRTRPRSRSSSYRIFRRAQAEARKKEWLERIELEASVRKPTVRTGAIVSGDQVIASTRSDIFTRIRETYNDAIAVEMEGKGFLDASFKFTSVEALVIRGISDLIDRKSESDSQGNQTLAADLAAAFAFHVLSCFRLNSGDANRKQMSFPRVCEGIAYEEIRSAALKTTFGEELDTCKDLMQNHQYDEAFGILKNLQKRKWHGLDEEQKRATLTNLAIINLRKGHLDEAANNIIAAGPYGKDHEGTQTNLVLAYTLKCEQRKAKELAERTIKRYPQSDAAWAGYLKTYEGEVTTDELLEMVPAPLQDSADILNALSLRALSQGNLDKGAIWAEKACEKNPVDANAWLLRGLATVELVLKYLAPSPDGQISEHRKGLLESAEGYLTKAIDLAEEMHDLNILAESYFKRNICRRILDKIAEADEDLSSFLKLKPESAAALTEKALLAVGKGDLAKAESLLHQALEKDKSDRSVRRQLITVLSQQEGEKTMEAFGLSVDLIKDSTLAFVGRMDVVHVAITLCEKLDNIDLLVAVYQDLVKHEADSIFPPIFAAIVEARRGKGENAYKYAKHAHELIGRNTPSCMLRSLAEIFMDLNKYEAALDLWQRVATEEGHLYDLKAIIACAQELDRDSVILEACETARQKGHWEDKLMQLEFHYLQQYDPLRAVDILQERLKHYPEDYVPRALLSILGMQLRRADLMVLGPGALPEPAGVDLDIGLVIAKALRACGYAKEGLEYLYQMLRQNYGNSKVRRAYIQYFMIRDMAAGPQPELETPDEVQANCAVSFKEDSYADVRWFVIEDSQPQRNELGEYPASHPLSQKFMSKKVGDVITLENVPVERTATIVTILSKYVRRFQELLEDAMRIPQEEPFVWGFNIRKVGAESEYDFEHMAKFMRGLWEQKQHAKEKYIEGNVPVRILGGESFKALVMAATNLDLRVQVCSGHPIERRYAIDLIRGTDPIIIDNTALATIWLLEWEHVFDSLEGRVCIGPMSRHLLEESFDAHLNSAGSLAPTRGGFVVVPRDEREEEGYQVRVERFLGRVRKSIKLVPSVELSAMEAKQRELLIGVLGRDGAEAASIAARENYTLWTDDNVLSMLAYGLSSHEYRRVWTEAVSQAMVLTGKMKYEEHLSNAARLLTWGYCFTPLNAAIMIKVCEQVEWDATCRMLQPAFEQIAAEGTDERVLPRIICEFLSELYGRPHPRFVRELLVQGLLGAVAQRLNGRRLIAEIQESIESAFGMNIIAAKQAKDAIDTWIRFQ